MILYGAYVYSLDPPVFSMADSFVPRMLAILPEDVRQRATFLVFPTWTKEPWRRIASTLWRMRSWPKIRLIWMGSTRREVRRLRSLGFEARWCHQNLFCNEDDLQLLPSTDRPFDAVYNAVLMPYKRHHLLAGVSKLRLITGSLDRLAELPKLGLTHATVNDRFLTKSEVAQVLSQCKCGLALSAEEGGMLASTEYLLCGLPVVSTPSIGGRDVYYSDTNHIACEPSIDSVAEAVTAAVARDWDRAAIRRAAIDRSKHFRQALSDCVREIAGTSPFDANTITGTWFIQNFLAIHFMAEFFAGVSGGAFRRDDLLGRFQTEAAA